MLGKVSACHLISQARKASKFLILLLKGLIPPFLLKNIVQLEYVFFDSLAVVWQFVGCDQPKQIM